MVRRQFALYKDIDYIVWICPSGARLSDVMEEIFKKPVDLSARTSIPKDDPLGKMKVYVLKRSEFLPKLQVREARVEDNDDLIPILQQNNPQLLEGQEDFFLADLISSQNERNSFFVGVHRGHVVGLLATSLDVNVSLITKIYDISPFPDIVIQKEERPLPPPEIVLLVGDIRLLKRIPDLQGLIESYGCLSVDAEALLSSVAFVNQGEQACASAVEILNNHIRKLLEDPSRQGPNVPGAVVVIGFPRSDEEVRLCTRVKFLPVGWVTARF